MRLLWVLYFYAFLLFVAISFSNIQSARGSDDEDRLVTDLFRSYNKLIRPVMNKTDHMVVKFGMALIQLINVNEIQQILKTNVWLRLIWYDYQLIWDPSDYGNVKNIRISYHKIWTPDIVLFNNADGKYEVSTKCNVVLHHDGQVLWVPPSIYKSTCIMDVRYFPFDQQHCEMKFGSWTFNGDEVGLAFYDDKDYIDLNDYSISGTWDIINVPGTLNIYNYTDKPKKTDITFHLYIRRKTLFYTVNLLAPCMMMSFMSFLVFYLPPDGNEKITLGISILLAIVLFQLVVAKILPPTSVCIPLISKYLLFTFSVNLICVLFTLIIVNWNFREGSIHTIPPILRKVFIECLPKYIGMSRPGILRPSRSMAMLNKSIPSKLNVAAMTTGVAPILALTPLEYGGVVGVKLPIGVAPPSVVQTLGKKSNRGKIGMVLSSIFLCRKWGKKESGRKLSAVLDEVKAVDNKSSKTAASSSNRSIYHSKQQIFGVPDGGTYRNVSYKESFGSSQLYTSNASKWLNIGSEEQLVTGHLNPQNFACYDNQNYHQSLDEIDKFGSASLHNISSTCKTKKSNKLSTLPADISSLKTVLEQRKPKIKSRNKIRAKCLKFKSKSKLRSIESLKQVADKIDLEYDDDLLIKWQMLQKIKERQFSLSAVGGLIPSLRDRQKKLLHRNEKRWNGIDYGHYQKVACRKRPSMYEKSEPPPDFLIASSYASDIYGISHSSSTRPLFESNQKLDSNLVYDYSESYHVPSAFHKDQISKSRHENARAENLNWAADRIKVDETDESEQRSNKSHLKRQKISFDISNTSDSCNNGSGQSEKNSSKQDNLVRKSKYGKGISLGEPRLDSKREDYVSTKQTPLLTDNERNTLIQSVTKNITFVANHIRGEDEAAIEKEDWKYIAIVVDRVLLYIFLIVSIAGTIGIIISAPHIFESVDQQERIQFLTGKKSE